MIRYHTEVLSRCWFFFRFLKMFDFFSSEVFFLISKKYFFSELKKKVGYSFDVKKCDLSIADVFRAIRALLLPEIFPTKKHQIFFHYPKNIENQAFQRKKIPKIKFRTTPTRIQVSSMMVGLNDRGWTFSINSTSGEVQRREVGDLLKIDGFQAFGALFQK